MKGLTKRDWIVFADWCQIQVERIDNLPNRAPRIMEITEGDHAGMIQVVDDKYTVPKVNAHTDGVIIKRYHNTRKQWS